MACHHSSDLHLDHHNIMQYCPGRPGSSPREMSEILIANWNRKVAPDDTVYVHGDVAMGKIADSLPLVGRLNGRKILIAGNHDRCWSGHGRKARGWADKYLDAGFEMIVEHAWIRLDGHDVMLTHFPFEGDSHEEDRYVEFRPRDLGQWLLHGHVHDKWKVNGRQINVGCDVWGYAPVSQAEIAALMRAAEAEAAALPGGSC